MPYASIVRPPAPAPALACVDLHAPPPLIPLWELTRALAAVRTHLEKVARCPVCMAEKRYATMADIAAHLESGYCRRVLDQHKSHLPQHSPIHFGTTRTDRSIQTLGFPI